MSDAKGGAGILGIGVAACVACCAGPILGFLAAVGLGTAIGFEVFGVAGLALALLAMVPILRRRRQQAACTPPAGETVGVALGRKDR